MTSDLRLLDVGEGTPVVLLHGGLPGRPGYAASLDVFGPITGRLAAAGHRVIAIDRPGFGGSPAASAGELSFAGAEAAVLAVLDEIGVGEFHVAGHGEGGLLALRLARGGRVLSCAVLAGNEAAPTGDSPWSPYLTCPPAAPRRAQAWYLDRLSHTPHHIDDAFLDMATTHAARQASAPAPPRPAADLLGAKDALFAYARDHGYGVPISLIWGSDDPVSPVERGVALLDLLASTTAELAFHVVNRTGHFPFRERPDEVLGLLVPFFARAQAAPRAAEKAGAR